jgi:hypothetical protein
MLCTLVIAIGTFPYALRAVATPWSLDQDMIVCNTFKKPFDPGSPQAFDNEVKEKNIQAENKTNLLRVMAVRRIHLSFTSKLPTSLPRTS